MSEELKPCPFCGSEKITMIHKGNAHTRSRSVTIKCKKCLCKREIGAIRHTMEWCEEQSIATWNTRTQPDKELVEALEKIVLNVGKDCEDCLIIACQALSKYKEKK
jgi:Lar family restriction alleviation protein